MPRASCLTDALTTAIARDLRAGKTLGEAARASGVSRATAYAWLQDGAREVDGGGELSASGSFCQAVRAARAAFACEQLEKINRLLRADRPTPEMERDALAARRTLERRFPEFWGADRARAGDALRHELAAFQQRAHTGMGAQMPSGMEG